MTFEFLIVYHATADTDIRAIITEALAEALEGNLNELDEDAVHQMIELRHERMGDDVTTETGEASRYTLLDFAIELPEDTALADMVIRDFTGVLRTTEPIKHIVQFEDPLLEAELAARATDIFALEMKLRRVLSLVYLHAYQNGNPYDLLCDETVKPTAKEPPKPEQMASMSENQFFHLTFSDYIKLNQRRDRNLTALIDMIRTTDQYEAFRSEITRMPVQHEDDAVLLAGLKERMDAIEEMRNCVAHNRRPTPRVAENYRNARPLLDEMLNSYLAHWEVGERRRDNEQDVVANAEAPPENPPADDHQSPPTDH